MLENNATTSSSGSPLGEISQEPPALEVFLDKHQMKIIALAVLLVIFAIAYVIYDGVQESGEQSAGALLSQAEDISDLQSVVKNHEGTAAAYSSKVLLAEKQWGDGQQDEAIATLRAFVEGGRDHPARSSAEASLASKLLAQGKVEEAKGYFRDLTEDPASRYLAPYAWISLGDIEIAEGNVEAAATAYEAVEREHPGSALASEAMERLALLKAQMPVEVAATIEVPEVKLSEDALEGEAEIEVPLGDASMEDLIDAVKQGGAMGAEAPPFPAEEPAAADAE